MSKIDFLIDGDRKRGLVFYTPTSHKAYDWARVNLERVPLFGRSYMFATGNPRADKLRGYLKGQGMAVEDLRGKGRKA